MSAPAHAESKPPRGTWKKLAVRTFSVPAHTGLGQLDRLDTLARALRPEGAKISELHVANEHGGAVRISFRAQMKVEVDLGPLHLTRDTDFVVRARATSSRASCGRDASRQAVVVRLDLAESDEPVAANADAFVASVCAGTEPGTLELTTFMQVGPDYGTRAAGRIATTLLTRQTDAVVRAILGVLGEGTGPQALR